MQIEWLVEWNDPNKQINCLFYNKHWFLDGVLRGRGMEQYFPLCSIEKPKYGTKQDEKSFPSSTSLSSVHISLWWKIHSSCGLYPFVYFWQHFIFAAVPCSLFHHFLLNKINNYVEWTQKEIPQLLHCRDFLYWAHLLYFPSIKMKIWWSWLEDERPWKMWKQR